MRLNRIARRRISTGEAEAFILIVEFSVGGILASVSLELPVDWEQLTRTQKVAWAKQEIAAHLARHVYESSDEVIFPDLMAAEQAADDFEALPGWATWTASEAEAFIRDSVFNGNDLATVQSQIDALPATIAGMKAGLKNAADAIIQLRSNQEKIVKAIVLLRDRTIER